MNRLIKYFLRGLLVVVPLAATAYILYLLFVKVDRWLGIGIPGVGFLLTVALITLIGLVASNIITRKVIESMERLFVRLPLVKLLYFSIKDLIEAFVGEKRGFDRPVVVSLFPDGAAKIPGFITRESLAFLGLPDHVAVYFPQSYNFAGAVLLMPKERVKPVEVRSADYMAFILSGGVSGMMKKVES